MSDGFRSNPPMGSVIVQGFFLNTTTPVPLNAETADITAFPAIELAIYATGTSGGTAGLLQLQLLWKDSFNGNVLWVDTIEVNFDTVPGYLAKRAFVITPVRGAFCQIVSNGGTNPPLNPTVNINVYGLTTPVPRLVCWQDASNFTASDLLIMNQTGGAIATGGFVGPFNGGLGSGPVSVNLAVAFTTATGTGGFARLRFTFGSTTVGWPDLNMLQPSPGNALAVSTIFTAYMPRRPVIAVLADVQSVTPHNTINSWQISIVRDEP